MSNIKLLEAQWLADVKQAIAFAELSFGEDVVSTRNALYALWLTVDQSPGSIRDLFRQFKEEDLAKAGGDITAKELFTNLPLAVGSVAERTKLLYALAVRIRALEAALHEISGDEPVRHENQCLARYGEAEAFILLRNPRHRTAATKQSFRRRGLVSSRVFPREIKGYRVKLLLPDDPRGRKRAAARKELSFGAGLFADMTFDVGHDADGFFIRDVSIPDQIATIRGHIAVASSSDCHGIVYPELTITSSTLLEICNGIGTGEWVCDLSLLVAGSRHAEVGQQRFNICSILNGYGEEIAQHRKLLQYSDGKEVESIQLGDELQILVLPDAIFAFGICLDFCNTSEDPPYADLDVDYVLVPSCGNERTMSGHVRRSAEYMDKQKTRTLVVQQFYSEGATGDLPLGYVLARCDDVTIQVKDLEKRNPWEIYNI
ncbi:hypothetical protein G8O24_26400 [Bradyrhizobium sp. INPA01-394B]|uniref:Uncharacterized protein n=1 Tax=Bradyrhizobium campsiandrae TaxID=1729892 RepID=A0ABR7U8B9_9BRAD|nr:hypothetical protein [Bradyrhizobium campsiandrae]MBC9880862.1 hypothetical protein [Bradyrhizobium campsiandrae]MBC9980304.1 hypothetical protein [Bradyrhizobium campsiandrae]